MGAEEGGGGGAEVGDGEAAIDLDHLAADGELGDFAALVGLIAAPEPVLGGGVEETVGDGPMHESGAGVAGPERAVAIEDGGARGEGVDRGFEVSGSEDAGAGGGHAVSIL